MSSKISPLPSIFLESGFNSGASMWFSLDSSSSSSWEPSIVSGTTSTSSSSNLPISTLSSSSSFFSKIDTSINAPSNIDWQANSTMMKKNVVKPKQLKVVSTDPLTKTSTPAEDFVKIAPNQRWNAQPIGFSNVQNQSYLVEKKTSMPVLTKSMEDLSVQQQPSNQSQPDEDESNQSLYKTELCRSFEETGSCRYGLKCQFAHGRSELRHVSRHPKYKTEVCKTFHTIGTCPYGKRCRFIHIEPALNQVVPTKTIPVPPKPTEFVNVSQNNSGWNTDWNTPTPPKSVNVFLPVGTPKKSPMIEAVPVMKTSNEMIQPRSRLVIFQQICS
jgi:hypothetical protein